MPTIPPPPHPVQYPDSSYSVFGLRRRAATTMDTDVQVTGYIVEKSLSMDNVFVIALIFSFFAIPRKYQHRVLFWGILGVIVLRAIMIALGATLIEQFHGILYFFGAFLVFTGVKMWWMADHDPDIATNPVLRFLRKHMRVTDQLEGNAFWVKKAEPATGKVVRYATPLLLALVMVELADLVFAVDSIPAVFAITTDPFVVYTSNIFAILGLRAMYFLLANAKEKFHFLSHALGGILVFVGLKMAVSHWYHMNTYLSLAIILTMLATAIVLSINRNKRAIALDVTKPEGAAVVKRMALAMVCRWIFRIPYSIPPR